MATTQTIRTAVFIAFRGNSANNNANGVTVYVQRHNTDREYHPKVGDCVTQHYGDHYDNNRWRQAYTIDYETTAILGYQPSYVIF